MILFMTRALLSPTRTAIACHLCFTDRLKQSTSSLIDIPLTPRAPSSLPTSSLTDDLACCFRLAPLAGALDQFTGPQLTVWIPSFAQADCCLIVHFGEAKLTLLPLLGLSHCWCLRPLATVLFTELVGGLNFFCNALAASLSVVARGLAFWLNLLRSDLVFFW